MRSRLVYFQDYTLTLYLHQYWKDERLAWAKTGNLSMTLSGDFSKNIWVPDTFLANDKHSFIHDVTETNKMLRLYSDGYISYGMRYGMIGTKSWLDPRGLVDLLGNYWKNAVAAAYWLGPMLQDLKCRFRF